MNKDIRLSVKFFEHPKTIKLERRLGIQGVKALIKLWMWAALNKPEGDLGHDAEDIEIAAQWSGEPELFSKALVDLRWLDHIDGRYRLHDWIEHNPWAAKDGTRSDKARFSRMAKTHPAICKALRERGIDEISASDFERLTKNNESLENLTNRSDLETNRSTPALLLLLLLQKKKQKRWWWIQFQHYPRATGKPAEPLTDRPPPPPPLG